MADQLSMNGLSLNDSKHAGPQGGMNGRSAYIPPHLRGSGRGPPPSGPPMGMDGAPPAGPNPGLQQSAWGNNA